MALAVRKRQRTKEVNKETKAIVLSELKNEENSCKGTNLYVGILLIIKQKSLVN